MTTRDWIDAAFELLQQPLPDGEVLERLASRGCPEATANELLLFLPLACGRAILSNTGVSLPAAFRVMHEDGSVSDPRALSSHPCWREAAAFVKDRMRSVPNAIAIVGRRSAEFDAVNKAALAGSRLSDLVGSEPILMFPEPNVPLKVTRKPWWAFWRRTLSRSQ